MLHRSPRPWARARVSTALLALAVSAGAPSADARPAYHRPAPRAGAPALPSRPYDVLRYELSIGLDLDARFLRGEAVITVEITEATSTIELDLEGLTVDSISVDGEAADFIQTADTALIFALPETTGPGDRLTLSVDYHGSPSLNDERLGLSIRPSSGTGGIEDVAYTITEPDGSRRWFPCNDTPADKAALSLTVAVPTAGDDAPWVVGANGLLEAEGPATFLGADDAPVDAWAYAWVEDHPIAPYLIAFGAAPYEVFGPDDDGGVTVPITFFARPRYQGSARAQWGDTGQQLAAFQDLFGPYPFDKYGLIEAPMPFAAMEHQTLTLWQSSLFSAAVDASAISAHELAHHWFGDLVTPRAWEDIWLSEGLATYSEALWAESQGGQEALSASMDAVHATYLAFHSYDADTSLYDPEELFGVTSYEKGASVMHLLRRILGDDAFFAGLNAYLDEHAYGGVSTDDLRAALEAAHEADLGAFFDAWVYAADAPFPRVKVGWDVSGDGVRFGVVQSETGADFAFPLPVRLTLRGGEVIDADLAVAPATAQRFSLATARRVTGVEIDPDGWVLAEVELADDLPGQDCGEPVVCDPQAEASCARGVQGADCQIAAGVGCGGCATGAGPGGGAGGWASLTALVALAALRRRRGGSIPH